MSGDLVLFSRRRGFHIFSRLVDWATDSQFSHVGMIVSDPTWIHPWLRGEFLWQSTRTIVPNAEDNKHVFGVQLTPLHCAVRANPDYTLVRRRVHSGADIFTPSALADIHSVVHERPYDIIPRDWVQAALHRGCNAGAPNSFYCSALVGYILWRLDCLPHDSNWRLIRPVDLSTEVPMPLPLKHVTYGPEGAV